jgi:hypothetical protein
MGIGYTEEVVCTECKSILTSLKDRCTYCGSNKKTLKIAIEDTMPETLDTIKFKAKDKTKNRRKNPVLEVFQGYDRYKKTGEIVKKIRDIDKINYKYYEHVEKLDGTVIHHCEEKLTDHRGHGSAKFKN